MYNNLIAEIARNHLKNKNIAEAVGISERALKNKIKGVSEFYWREVVLIKTLFFPSLALEYLFEKGGGNNAA